MSFRHTLLSYSFVGLLFTIPHSPRFSFARVACPLNEEEMIYKKDEIQKHKASYKYNSKYYNFVEK